MKTYVLTTFDDARDIIPILEHRRDPTEDIIKQQPKDLMEVDKDSEVAKWMKMEKVKQHIKRLLTLENNKETLYGIIWGQCLSGLQEVIKGDNEYISKAGDFDCIWLLNKTKLVSSGVDEKSNKYCTLIKSITALTTIRQGASESNDSFRKRLDANALTMELAGGKHVMYSKQISTAADKENPTPEEVEKEKQKLKKHSTGQE